MLSCFVLDTDPEGGQADERDASLAERRPPVFWARGDMDQVITPDKIAQTLRWLPAHAEAHIELYPGLMHSVSAEEIADLSAWMRAR